MLPKGRHITPKWAWLWSRDGYKILPFAAMQRVARVRLRQLTVAYVSRRCCISCATNAAATANVLYAIVESNIRRCFGYPDCI